MKVTFIYVFSTIGRGYCIRTTLQSGALVEREIIINETGLQKQEQIKMVDSIKEVDSFIVIRLSCKINEMLALKLLKYSVSKYVHTTQNNIRDYNL